MLQKSRPLGRFVECSLARDRGSPAGKRSLERANAIGRQPFRSARAKQLLPAVVACLQPVDQLLLASRPSPRAPA